MIPTFHPAAILHGGGERSSQFQDLRADFALVQRTLAGADGPADEPPPGEPPLEPAPPPAQVPGLASRLDAPVIVPEQPAEEQLGLF